MKVSYAYIQEFVSQLDTLDKRTGQTIGTEIVARDLAARIEDGDEEAYAELARLMQDTVRSSARLSSAMTTRFYNGVREASGVNGSYSAESYDTVDSSSLYGATYSVAKEYADGRTSKPLAGLLTDVASRFTRYSSNETVRRNAAKDPAKPKFAIVPSPSACVFCLMRASNGYEYPSAANVESHNNCKCQAVQVYGDLKIQGYDPSRYEAEYLDARRAYKNGDISQELQDEIAAAKARHDQAYKDGTVSKRWDDTNAILMVWREQRKGQ